MSTENTDLSTDELQKMARHARSGGTFPIEKVSCVRCGKRFSGLATQCPKCGQQYAPVDLLAAALEELLRARAATPKPAVIFCEACGELHVDKLEEDGTDWTKRSHRKHLCHFCGHVWQPFDFPTYGVPLPTTLTEAINSLNISVSEATQQRDDLQGKLAGAETELAAQKELQATTAAQLAEAQQLIDELLAELGRVTR